MIKKKGIIVFTIILVWVIFFLIDFYRCSNLTFPIFMIQKDSLTNETTIFPNYYGLGYKANFLVSTSYQPIDQPVVRSMSMSLFGKKIKSIAYTFSEGTILKIENNKVLIELEQKMSTDPIGQYWIILDKKTKVVSKSNEMVDLSVLNLESRIEVTYNKYEFFKEKKEIRHPYSIRILNERDN